MRGRMNIAIVAPTSVPYVVGGAENLYQSLSRYFNVETSHSCEIVTLPSPEGSFSEVLASYRKFSEIDLDRFDLVISTKYPSWMISHRNHVCYMLHPLRGLYDTYHFMNMPFELDWAGEGLGELKNYMDATLQSPSLDNQVLDQFFDRVDEIVRSERFSHLLGFPGPFIREIVHFLDAYALSPQRVKRHFAISATVANRAGYFPQGVSVGVLYPAPLIDRFDCKDANYFFTASRHDGPKRIDLLIRAFMRVDADLDFIIAGDGPQRQALESLAAGDSRIKFVGRVNDDELRGYYADALAIVYAPYDEDYGYITVEAMKSSKPVVTTTDAGGPNEFVIDGENGFVVAPLPERIAEKIEFLHRNRDLAREMGARALSTVREVAWRSVAEKLVEPGRKASETTISGAAGSGGKPRMIVAVTFPAYPPRGGGQARVFNLYRNLAKYYEIEIVCLCSPELAAQSSEISPGLVETRVPLSSEFVAYDHNLSKSVDWVPVTDIASIDGFNLLNDYCTILKERLEKADIVVACHPYLINAIRQANSRATLWYEAQDVESDLKKQILRDTECSVKLLSSVREVEKYCWENAEVVFACTREDLQRLAEVYGETSARRVVVPNGVDYSLAVFLGSDQKIALKKKLGIESKKTVLFMGSWHGPNLEAIEEIIKIATVFPDVYFLIIGSAGLAFEKSALPKNIIVFGVLDDEMKNVVMCASDIAINPMMSGSGSNLKIVDYFAYGLPVLSTPFGIRGIEAVAGKDLIVADIRAFQMELSGFFSLPERYDAMRSSCRRLAENLYAWDRIATNFHYALAHKN